MRLKNIRHELGILRKIEFHTALKDELKKEIIQSGTLRMELGNSKSVRILGLRL